MGCNGCHRSTTRPTRTCARPGPDLTRIAGKTTRAGPTSGSRRRATSTRRPSCRTSSTRRTPRLRRTRSGRRAEIARHRRLSVGQVRVGRRTTRPARRATRRAARSSSSRRLRRLPHPRRQGQARRLLPEDQPPARPQPGAHRQQGRPRLALRLGEEPEAVLPRHAHAQPAPDRPGGGRRHRLPAVAAATAKFENAAPAGGRREGARRAALRVPPNKYTIERSEHEARRDARAADATSSSASRRSPSTAATAATTSRASRTPSRSAPSSPQEGSKPLHQFDFGHVHDVPHTRHDWIEDQAPAPAHAGTRARSRSRTTTSCSRCRTSACPSARRRRSRPTSSASPRSRRSATRKAGTRQQPHGDAGRGPQAHHPLQLPGLPPDRRARPRDQGTSSRTSAMLPPNLAAEGARVQADWLFELPPRSRAG